MKIFKRIMIALFVLLFAFASTMLYMYKDRPEYFINMFFDNEYNSKYIYVTERGSDDVLIKRQVHKRAYPASFTKIMTTLVAIENIDDPTAGATIDQQSYQRVVSENASMAGFVPGERLTYLDLLYGTMLPSGGEATASLAISVAGSEEAFIELMNAKAQEIGMVNTNYVNTVGMHDDEHYTTASDMVILLDYALDNELFKEVFTTEEYYSSRTNVHPNGVRLRSTVLSMLHDVEIEGVEITGGKSGTTYEAGQNWITSGIVHDKEYIVVVMHAPFTDIGNTEDLQIEDTKKIYQKIADGEY